MRIPLEDIPPQGLDWKSQEEESSFLIDEEGLSFSSPMKLNIRLTREGEKVLLSGNIEAELELVCSRCLEPCRHRLSTQLKLVYYPLPSRVESAVELKERDLQVDYYQEGIIDLREDVREAVILALPPKPLCHPECRGLCSHCGQNLNEKECECQKEQIDPRLAKLKELLK